MVLRKGVAYLDDKEEARVFDHLKVKLVAREVDYRRSFQIILIGKAKPELLEEEMKEDLSSAVKSKKKKK